MVTNKKAQGLPLNLIVIAVIAALVLVLIIAFTIGGFGFSLGKIFGAGQTIVGEDIDIAKTACSGYCDSAKNALTTTGWTISQYCTKTFSIDTSGDGELTEDETGLTCLDIGVSCSTVISGQTCSVDATRGCYCEAPTTTNQTG